MNSPAGTTKNREPMTRLDIHARPNDGTMKYYYELRTSDSVAAGPLEQEYSVDVAQDVVLGLRERIDAVLAKSLDGETDHRAELAEYGQALFRQLFRPGDASNLVNRIKESTGPFLVRTNESVVPWELLHDGSDFLGLAYDIGRHSIVGRRVTAGRHVDHIRRALIVGDPLKDLDAARQEAEQIAAWLRERGAECTVLLGEQANLADVVMRLGTPYDLFHFCGHVASKFGSDYCGLLLHGRKLLDEQGLMTIEQVGAPPIVFVNGCDSAGRVANICLSFMVLGAKTVVGTSAEVPSDGALRFAERFYQSLLGGATAGAAMRTARTSMTDERHAAWASFTLYGDPGEYISAGDAKRAPRADTPPEDERDEGFTAEARELIVRAEKLAGSHERVTSLDLLATLVTTPELRSGMEKRIGVQQVASVIQLLFTINEALATRKTEGRATEWSDTVKNVFDDAVRRATSDGRGAATPQDIADAFVRSGGGSSATLLERFIDLDELLSSSPSTEHTAEQSMSRPRPAVDGGELFGPDGRLRADLLDDSAGAALRAALLMAVARGERAVSSYRLLRGFGLVGSPVLGRLLAEQGEKGERAFRELGSGAEPHQGDLSERVVAALADAARGRADGPVGEAAILYALLAQERSTARKVLRELGVDGELLLRALRAELGGDTP